MNINIIKGPEKQGNHDVENLSQILHACWLISCLLSARQSFSSQLNSYEKENWYGHETDWKIKKKDSYN